MIGLPSWLDVIKKDDLEMIAHVWKHLRHFLRLSDPTPAEREETEMMIRRFSEELNCRFPTTKWTNYVMELIWNVPIFLNDQVALARKSEDGFEGMIWELKNMPTNNGGGTTTEGGDHKEDPEYQILARLWSTHDPSKITQRASMVVTESRRKQCCTKCESPGHNVRTCPQKTVRSRV